jgi:flagellar protein FliS
MQQTSYLEAKIKTASPPRLHLMLIEGAIRFGRQAEEARQNGDTLGSSSALLRVIDILGELVAGVRKQKSDLNSQIADLYWFLFRRTSEAKINGDGAALAEVLQLLEYERQTWQQLCDKLNGDKSGSPPAPRSAAFGLGRGPATTSGLSFEA